MAARDFSPLQPGTTRAVCQQRRPKLSACYRTLVTVLIASLGALIGLQLRAWNGTVNADAIIYIALCALYAKGDLSAPANRYWSPLYPLLLRAAFGQPGARCSI